MSGKGFEKQFEALFLPYGKLAYLHRFDDTADLRGRNNGMALIAKEQPSDYLVTVDGETAYAEVKSTEDPSRFKKSMIRTGQITAARKQCAAGGKYWVFVHSNVLRQWFKIPAEFILQSSQASWLWEELWAFRHA